MVKNNHYFLPMKMKGKTKNLTINITLIYKNNNYYELKNFIQINNYCELEIVISILY